MNLIETTLKKHTLYRGKIINLRVDDAALPDGTPCKREVVEHPGGASVLCVREQCVLLVRQFRYAYGEVLAEIPAGKLSPGEDPRAAAQRELEEETGMRAERLVPIVTLYPTPGYTNEKIYLFFAEGLSEGRAHPDEGEWLSVEWMPIALAAEKIAAGEIRDAKTIVALQWYQSRT